MKKNLLNWVIALLLFVIPTTMFGQNPPDLGSASKFVLFTAVGDFNNDGASVVTGDIGTHVGVINGFPIPGTLIGNSYANDPGATQPAIDVLAAYGYLSTVTCGKVIGSILGNGQTLTPGVYCLGGTASLNGINGGLILDAQGNPDALFIFKVNGALTTSTYSNVILINGASECNVYWQINGLISLKDYSVFRGTALVNGAISILKGSKVYGRVLSTSGAVNISNIVATLPPCNLKPPVPTITGPKLVGINSIGNVYITETGMSNYIWTVPTGGTITSGGTATDNTVTVTWNTAGNQTVTVNYTDANGMTAVTPTVYPVKVMPLPVPTITGPTPVCLNTSGNVYTTESGMTNYIWAVSAGGVITSGGTTTSNTVTVTWNTTGAKTISVNYTDAYNNTAATPTVYNVTVNTLPVATITPGGATTFCQGNSVLLTSSPGSSYLWSTGATTQSITATTSGDYTVTVKNGSDCTATSTATTVTVNPLPVATVTPAGDVTICVGNSVLLASSTGTSYLWSTGETTKDITVATAGDYSVEVTNGNGCKATSLASTVAVNPLPKAIITPSGPTAICAGNSVTLTVSNNSSYLWSNGETTQSITVITAGEYSVVVTNACGKTNTSAVTAVTINPLPNQATISPAGSTTICQGNSTILTASTGNSYLWSNGATTQSITVTTAGDYSVTVESGCTSTSAATTVVVNPLSIATITPKGATTFCEGGSVILTSSPGNINWSTGETTQSITVKKGGDYYVTVTGGAGCSVTSAATTVTVNPMPTPTITANGTTNICQGNSVTLNSSSASSYLWSNGATTASITVSEAGSYYVTVSNGIGCTGTSATTAVTVIPLATATITAAGETNFCEGNSVVLTASAGESYMWSNGATTRSITVTQSGNYSVYVTDATNCNPANAMQVVTVIPLPVVSLDQLPAGVNITSPSILLSGLPSGGTFTGEGVTGSSFNPSVAGLGNTLITYTYTNENNCSNSVNEYLLVYDTIGHVCIDTIHVTINDTVKICLETKYDTIHVSVTDTLIINVPLNGVGSPNDYNTIKVYPNPTSSFVYINTGNYAEMNGYKIKITNSIGQTVFQNSINQQLFNIDLSTFGTKGIYFIQIINPSSRVIDTRKIILQ